MSYNFPSSSSTLSSSERSREALHLLQLLREVDEEELSKLTDNAKSFLRDMWLRADLLPAGGELKVTENQLYFLRDTWNRFA